MSKLYYDKYLQLEEIEIELRGLDLTTDEKKEFEQLIDETIHHRVLDRVLKHLPRAHHEEFLQKFHEAPYDEKLLDYIDERIEEKIEVHIKDEIEKIKKEILEDIKSSKNKE